MAKQHRCKYCGARLIRTNICNNCRVKLPLVQKLLAMVRDTFPDYKPKQTDEEDTACMTSNK